MRILWTALCAVALAGPVAAQDGRLTVELNKVEPGEVGGCRAFFLFRNLTSVTLEDFEMSLAILDSAGIIDRLLTIDAAPLPVGRTTLKLFEVPETECPAISEILLHDIPACADPSGAEVNCFANLDLVSRADARLTK